MEFCPPRRAILSAELRKLRAVMEIVVAVIAIICAVVGIIGSVAPALPGPPLAWIGVLLMYFWGGTNGDGEPMSLTILLVMLGVIVLVTVLDYIVPAWFTKTTGGSKYASRGAMAGLFLGMFIPLPVGMIVTSLVCSFLAELLFSRKDAAGSLKSALGAFLGFLFGSGIKIIACGVMLWYIIVYI